MKAVQIGILAALVLCAGLLLKVYRSQQPAPLPQTASQVAPAPQAPAPAAQPAPAPEAVAPAPVEPAKPPASEATKPSPARRARVKEVARSQPAAPAVAAAPPAAPAVQEPAHNTPAEPRAEAPAAQPLNPPPGTVTAPPEPPREPHKVTIAAGTSISVRLAETINSAQRHPGDTFSATLDQPLIVDGFAIAERGAKVQGKIVQQQESGRIAGSSSIVLALTRLHTSDGQDVAINTEQFTKEGPGHGRETARNTGIGAALGAAIGAIAGGGKGAAIGAGVGGAAGAGTSAAKGGKPAEIPVETRLTFRLSEPVTITEKLR